VCVCVCVCACVCVRAWRMGLCVCVGGGGGARTAHESSLCFEDVSEANMMVLQHEAHKLKDERP
jgi:hypothetical protein